MLGFFTAYICCGLIEITYIKSSIFLVLSNLLFGVLCAVSFINGTENVEIGNFCVIDQMNLPFIWLTFFIFPLCFMYVEKSVFFYKDLVRQLLFCTEIMLIAAFLVNNLLLFYIFFELILIPMFLMIGLWGSRGRRIHATVQFFFLPRRDQYSY
jgi:NADH:ubiquinone oxidoreductase subunit 4 (subunit M)